MDLLTIVGHLGSFTTLESRIQDLVRNARSFSASRKLKKLCGTPDFSSLSEELAPIADQVERYLYQAKDDAAGGHLFPPASKEAFIRSYFQKHPDALPYRSEVTEILSRFADLLEANLLRNLSMGEAALYRLAQRIEEDNRQILELLRHLADPGPLPPEAVSKIQYDLPADYIPRTVIPHHVMMRDAAGRYPDKPVTLAEALEADGRLLLLSDAGHGKSFELENLAGVLCGTPVYPCLYPLSLYCREPISQLLPASYPDLPGLVLLFDGYDEMDGDRREEFLRRLRLFLRDRPSVKAVVSSRSNFCRAEVENQSLTFPGFRVYDLGGLTEGDILGYLAGQGIDAQAFWEDARRSETLPLLSNPFYLTKLAGLYRRGNALPPKAEVMDYLIAEGFRLDDGKFQGNLEERQRSLFGLLEKAAFAMQLMQRSALEDAGEYQALFTQEERELLKCSGLLRKEGTHWRFVHNNFKEYLAARRLSVLPEEEAVRYFSDGTGVKTSWVNTFGFLTGMDLDWDLKAWILEHDPSALVKFEPEHLEERVRVDVFKSIFLEAEEKMLWPEGGLYTPEQLAAFACCEESLLFLLEKIRRPAHRISQTYAILLLQHFPRLFGRQEEITRGLLDCCVSSDDPVLRRDILEALPALKLVTPQLADRLIETFQDCSDCYTRWGMYRMLTLSGQHNAHVQFFLDGIVYTRGGGRMSNETIALVDGLKALSEPESIQTVLRYLARAGSLSLFEEDEVYETLCGKAAEQFSAGRREYYQILLDCYTAAAKCYARPKMLAIAQFFASTDTLENAVADLCNTAGRYIELEPLFDRPEHLACAEQAYRDGRLKDRKAFHEIVSRYANDAQYREYAKLIAETDGAVLPERTPPTDFQRQTQERDQAYFDVLFDRAKAEQTLSDHIQKMPDPDPDLEDLLHARELFAYNSLAWKFHLRLYRRFCQPVKARAVFRTLDWDRFVAVEAASALRRKMALQVSGEQKAALGRLLRSLCREELFKNANLTSAEDYDLIAAVVFLAGYLDFQPEEAALLQMTELPSSCFSREIDKDGEAEKYAFLRRCLPEEILLDRVAENVSARRVHEDVLADHLRLCAECRREDVRDAAIEAAQTDAFAGDAAVAYLYKVFGPRCVQEALLPSAGQELLLDIARLCPDIAKQPLRAAMERQFQSEPSLELMAHLLTFGSEAALREYIRRAEEKRMPPEGNQQTFSGPTRAISTLRDPKLLPLLERLTDIALSPDFRDREVSSLNTNLGQALAACGEEAPEQVIEFLRSRQGTWETGELRFWFCSSVMDMIAQRQRQKLDTPWKLRDVRRALRDDP